MIDTPFTRLDALVREYVEDYELRDAEDAQGRVGDYQPDERERMLITDAIQGLIADEEFADLFVASRNYQREQRRKEGVCEACGAPPPIHWGQRCSAVSESEGIK